MSSRPIASSRAAPVPNDLVVRTPELAELIDLLRDDARRRRPTRRARAASRCQELERERNRRVFRQLERQVMLNTGLAKRCSALASELTVLTGISEAVLSHRDVDVALDEALATCFDAGGVSVGALYLLDEPWRAARASARRRSAWPPRGSRDVLRPRGAAALA